MLRPRLYPAIFVVFVLLGYPEAEAGTLEGHRIVNVVDDFLAYYQACRAADADVRAARWGPMLEEKHPQFFRDAVYRGKTGVDRDRYREDCIGRFWEEIVPDLPRISALNQGIEDKLRGVVRAFRERIPDFKTGADIYITISFSFRGKVVPVGGTNVLAVGLESFDTSGDLQFKITLAHELFHLYHFQFFSAGGGLYRLLWSEGLAVFASAMVVPGHRRSAYLGFPIKKMNQCHDLLPELAADLKRNLGQNDHRLKRIYFGAEPNDTRVPPEAGYYVGLLVMENLVQSTPLDQLARLPAKQAFGLLERELTILEKGE